LGFGGRIFEIDDIKADREIVAASSACLLIKKKFFQESNGFDPDFFVYMEGIDFSWRARLLGYKVYLCSTTYPWHKYDFDRLETRPWEMSALGKNRYLMVWWLGEIKSFFQVLSKIGALLTKKRQVQASRKVSDKKMGKMFLSSVDSVFVKNPLLDWVNPFFQFYYKKVIERL